MTDVRFPRLAYGLLIVAAVALSTTIASIARNHYAAGRVKPPEQMTASTVVRAPLDQSPIGAVGLVEPANQEHKIGTNVSAVVTQVFVTPGMRVARGDRLFALDPRIVEATLNQRRRDLATAEARLTLARARVPGLQAEAQAARAAVEAALADYDEAFDLVRIAGALKAGTSISARETTRRKNVLRTALARLSEARARLALAQANLNLFDERNGGDSIALEVAGVEQARAAVWLAESELELRTVRAPDDATVLQVNVRPGEFAEAGGSSQTLIITGRTETLHVRVDIDEADLPRFRTGAPATASMRGTQSGRLQLRFVRVEPLVLPKRALSGQPTERVDTRVLQAIYEVATESRTMWPGQQLDVLIEEDNAYRQAERLSAGSIAK